MDLVTVYTSVDASELQYLKSALESEGIRAFVLDEAIATLAPHYVFGQGGVRLAVADPDVSAAKALINDYIADKGQNGDPA